MRLYKPLRWFSLFIALALPGCNCGDEGVPPVINSFTATPDALGVDGGTVTLSWSVTGAKTLTLDPSAASLTPITDGTTTVVAAASTKYTLTATNSAGSVEQSASVCVATGPVTLSVSSPASYACHDPYKATLTMSNGTCQAVTLGGIELNATITSGACGPSSPGSYSPTVKQLAAGASDVMVFDLMSGAFCCGAPGCGASMTCQERFDFTVALDGGSVMQTSSSTLDLSNCDVVCP